MIQKHISLDLAKQIAEVAKEKGVVLPVAEHCWDCTDEANKEWFLKLYAGYVSGRSVPAYDTCELGEILPWGFTMKRYISHFRVGASSVYVRNGFKKFGIAPLDFEAKTEPEARGKMLLYLLKNDLLKTKTP